MPSLTPLFSLKTPGSAGQAATFQAAAARASAGRAYWSTALCAGLLALLTLVAGSVASAKAAELVMFQEHGCYWCERWDKEIGVVYDRTVEGRRAPLRRVDIHDPRPLDLRAIDRLNFTPTFVLINDGIEVGRITGYPGEDFFWPLLGRILAKLPAGPDDADGQAGQGSNGGAINEPTPIGLPAGDDEADLLRQVRK